MRVIIAGRLSRKAVDRDQTGFDSQERESVRWAESHGHEVVAVVADYKSGRSGLEARPNLRPWVTDPDKLGQYAAIVALKVDRLTRGNRAETSKLEEWARVHGKALMITGMDVHFPSEGTDGIQWDLMLRMAHQEWLNASERYTRMQRNRREAGSLVGRPPWGYEVVKDGTIKTLAPTPEGRKYVPQIFAAVIEGRSLRGIAAWLDTEGVATRHGGKWNEGYLGNILIRNPVYYGQRRNGGQLVTPALVTVSTWQEANAALSGRVRPGRATSVHPKPLVSAYCGQCYGQVRDGCPSGHSPMYRIFTGKGSNRKPYFRCTGHGPQRKGCGAPMLAVEAVEADVMEAMLANEMPHYERVFIAGDDRSDEIARLRERGAAAMRAGDYESASEAMREAAGLEALPRVAPHWKDVETNQSEARYCASLDREAQRAYLAESLITVTREGAVIVPRSW